MERTSRTDVKNFEIIHKLERTKILKLQKVLKSKNEDENRKCSLILLEPLLKFAYTTFYYK